LSRRSFFRVLHALLFLAVPGGGVALFLTQHVAVSPTGVLTIGAVFLGTFAGTFLTGHPVSVSFAHCVAVGVLLIAGALISVPLIIVPLCTLVLIGAGAGIGSAITCFRTRVSLVLTLAFLEEGYRGAATKCA